MEFFSVYNTHLNQGSMYTFSFAFENDRTQVTYKFCEPQSAPQRFTSDHCPLPNESIL